MSIKCTSFGAVASAAAGIIVSSSTNATPIVITLVANHGLKEGSRIAIAGVTGNTNANGEWTLSNVTGTTAVLAGSVGNGAHGGTVRVAVINDVTPVMRNHSACLALVGNPVGTLDIESYESYSDFAAGINTAGAVAPMASPSWCTNSAGSVSTPAKSTFALAATNPGIGGEMKLGRYMRMVMTAYTSGTVYSIIEA